MKTRFHLYPLLLLVILVLSTTAADANNLGEGQTKPVANPELYSPGVPGPELIGKSISALHITMEMRLWLTRLALN